LLLDKLLVDAAVEAGAELRDGFTVEEFVAEEGRVVGVRGRDRNGAAARVERARVTVGADGRNSRLARAVDAPVYEAVLPLTAWHFSYWSGVPADGLEVAVRRDKVMFSFPTNGGLFAVFIGWSLAAHAAVRAGVEESFMAALDECPELAQRVRAGRREERIYGMADVPNFLRKPHGPGWALVGDAGCHKDPFMALGICDAFRDAELLAGALHRGFSGEGALDTALADYEARRNEATLPEYRQNLESARFNPLPPQMVALRRALQGDAEQTRRFYMTVEGMV
jgi:flavin-dependent dehydrogenase